MALTANNIIRGYELKERLGEGGFGQVYRAYQPSVGREVAIKIILPEYANQSEFILRFEAEAQLVARLEHPYIVPLYDYWRDPQGAYLVMRYIRGGNLHQAINQQALDLTRVITTLEQVALALDVAHRHHVVHRDIKPDNILLDEEGNAYLSDFGIAQILKTESGEESQDNPDALTGSMGYLSPEQARGDPLSQRSDIYSLAVIAYELLAGRHPFYQYSPTVQMVKHLTENLPPIAHFRSDLPSRVDEVLQRATAKKPEERFGTAGDFVHALKVAIGEGTFAVQTGQAFTFDTKTQQIEASNPYKGLRPFEEADSEDFFGREALVRKLIERLEAPTTIKTAQKRETEPFRFLAVVGPSGSGKSSVVKAGLIPALRRGFLPGSKRWVITQMTPGHSPMQQLEHELLSISARQVKNLHDRLWASTNGLSSLVPELLPDANTEALLVIDQFEEVFTTGISEKERVLFLESIRQAVINPESRLRVIITLRADFYDRPLMYAGFGALLQKRTEVVLPLTPNELAQAIFAPAERVGIAVERGLAMEIAGEVADQPGGLPLLQYALTELFERRDGHIMARQAYRALGGVLGALTRRADEVYRSLSVSEQKAAKTAFKRLVTLGEGTEDTRRRVLRSELETLAPEVSRVIDVFGKARLLSFDRDPATRSPTVEVAHEALIRQWRILREWLNEGREHIRIQMHLTHAAQDWEAQGRDPGDLYRGARLAQASEWVENHPAEINLLERQFLDTSIQQLEHERAEKEAQRQRELETAQKLAETEKQRAEEQARAAGRLRMRGRFLAGALGLAIALLFAAAWFGYQANLQRQEAEIQRQQADEQRGIAEANFLQSEQLRLAAQANSNLLSGMEMESAPLLALAALKLGYTPEADLTLQRAMTYAYPVHILEGHSGNVSAVAISPNSQLAATTSADGIIHLWDIANGEQVRAFSAAGVTYSGLAFSPDGRWLAASGDDQLNHVWEVANGRETLQLSGHTDYIWSLAWSRDGRQIASVALDKTLQVWDTARGESLLVVEMPAPASSLAFSPDGSQILTAGDDNIARLYNASSGNLIRAFFGHRAVVISVAFSHSGQYILTGSDDKTARVWGAASGTLLTQFVGHQDSVYAVAFSADDRFVLTAGYDRQAILWDRESGVVMQRFTGHSGSLYGIDISPNDRWILTGSVDGTARLWPSYIDSNPRAFRHTTPVLSISLSADGSLLATGATGGYAALWDAQTGRQLFRLEGHEYPVESVSLSPDGKYLATAGDDYKIRLWLTGNGRRVRLYDDFTAAIWAVHFSPDGKILAAAGDDGLSLWSTFGGPRLRLLSGDSIFYAASFSPDGKTLLASGADGYSLYNVEAGELVKHIENDTSGSYYAAAISPDGRIAAVGGSKLRLLEFPSLEVIATLEGHTGAVLSTIFSPDGRLLLTSSADGTARLWDVASGQPVRTFSSLQTLANSAVFSKDGKQIYIGGADNVVWVWDVDYNDLMKTACAIIGRDLTPAERQKYDVPFTEPVCNAR
jgi:WD40 repeat protein/serine/threonine protein kinase